jgi:Rrf2 family iron-sulfur cluster assembly transcriptional regulator
VDLAQNQTRRPVALADIANRQSVSVSYLEQVFALLRQGGFVKSVRGPGGGYLLARPPEEIRVSDVFSTLAAAKSVGGENDDADTGRAGASVAGLWQALDQEMLRFLATITIKDVVDDAQGKIAQAKTGRSLAAA